jgi:hypothetical protein
VCCWGIGALKGHHPQACLGALVSTDDRPAVINNGAIYFVKVTAHPALHMVTTERKEWVARPGMIWAARAPVGRSGRSRVQVCLDCTLSPLGRRAMMGTSAGTMLAAGASVVRKWLVAPAIVRRRTEAVSA